MARQVRRLAEFHSIFLRTLGWRFANADVVPSYTNVSRAIHQNLPHQFKLSLRIADKVSFLNFTEEDWKKQLSAQEYHVCREKGTEPPWSGELLHNKTPGIYSCICCDADLFNSSTKYDSNSGWPSFWAAVEGDQTEEQKTLGVPNLSVDQLIDNSCGMVRVEVQCKHCGSHLGHVFRDGPKPTGLRYCINSIALRFKPVQQSNEKT